MRIEQLLYYTKAIRCQSINKAAQELYISQPSISKAIELLEKELGVKLVVRTNKGIVPTEIGQKVYDDSCEIIASIKSWKAMIQKDDSADAVLHVVGTSTVCDYLTDTYLALLNRTYPNIKIMLNDARRIDVIQIMEKRNIKIGIVSLLDDRIEESEAFYSEVRGNDWDMDFLIADERKVYVSSKNKLVQKEKVTMADIKKLPLACYSDPMDSVYKGFNQFFCSDKCYRVHNKDSILKMVSEDKTATIFPDKLNRTNYYIKNNLVTKLNVEGFELVAAKFFLIHQKPNRMTKMEKIVVNSLNDFFKKLASEVP